VTLLNWPQERRDIDRGWRWRVIKTRKTSDCQLRSVTAIPSLHFQPLLTYMTPLRDSSTGRAGDGTRTGDASEGSTSCQGRILTWISALVSGSQSAGNRHMRISKLPAGRSRIYGTEHGLEWTRAERVQVSFIAGSINRVHMLWKGSQVGMESKPEGTKRFGEGRRILCVGECTRFGIVVDQEGVAAPPSASRRLAVPARWIRR
jgi:hypothetical protein